LTELFEEMEEFLKTSFSKQGFPLKILQWLEFPIDEIKIEKIATSGADMCKVLFHLKLLMLLLILFLPFFLAFKVRLPYLVRACFYHISDGFFEELVLFVGILFAIVPQCRKLMC